MTAQEDDDIYGSLANVDSVTVESTRSSGSQPQASTSGRGQEVQKSSPARLPFLTAGNTVAAVKSQGQNLGTATKSVYLGNLQWWTTDSELERLCAEYGPIQDLKIYDERSNGKSKGFALVEYADAASAKACKEGLHGRSVNDKNIVATFPNPATPASQAPSGSSAVRPQGQRDAGRGRAAPYGRGRHNAQQGYGDDIGEPVRYASPHPMSMMGGMPMPHMMQEGMVIMPGPMMPMGPALPPNLPMPEDQYWGSNHDGYDAAYKRQRFY